MAKLPPGLERALLNQMMNADPSGVGGGGAASRGYRAGVGQMRQIDATIAGNAGGDAPVSTPMGQNSLTAATGIQAYHGSPYDFNEFDASKIGSGEGVHAYGQGFYLSNNRKIAERYRDMLTELHNNRPNTIENLPFNKDTIKILKGHSDPLVASFFTNSTINHTNNVYGNIGTSLDTIIKGLSGDQRSLDHSSFSLQHDFNRFIADRISNPDWLKPNFSLDTFHDRINRLSNAERQKLIDDFSNIRSRFTITRQPGKLYEVMINASPEQILSLGKPVSSQPIVRDALAKLGFPEEKMSMTGRAVINDLGNNLWPPRSNPLNDSTVLGLEYSDSPSKRIWPHDQPFPKGARATVIFDPKIINILKKYGFAGAGLGAALAAGGSPDQAQAAEEPIPVNRLTYHTGQTF